MNISEERLNFLHFAMYQEAYFLLTTITYFFKFFEINLNRQMD